MKEHEVGGPCGTNRGLKMHIEFWCLNVNRRDRSEDSRTGEGEAVTENGGRGGAALFSCRADNAQTRMTPVVSFRFDGTVFRRLCVLPSSRKNTKYVLWVCYVGLWVCYVGLLCGPVGLMWVWYVGLWVCYVGLFYIGRPSNGLYRGSFLLLVDKGIRNVVAVSYSDRPEGAAIGEDDWLAQR